MGLINLASYVSAWRGYEYYKGGRVKSFQQTDDDTYEGQVSGSGGAVYKTKIDLSHPRKSQCTCPFAAGKRIICKLMVAMFFAAFPEEAEDYYREVIEAEEEAEREQEAQENAVIEFVSKMKKAELQQTLLQVLFDGPEWQYERFIEEHLGRH